MITDRTGVATRRLGYAKYNATACTGGQPIRGMWPFYSQSGLQYLVMASSNSMFYSPGDGSCTVIPGLSGAISATANVECVQTLGMLWCTDGIDPVFSTNITSTQPVTQAPTGYHIGTFRNRVLISGVPGTGANGSGSQIYLSGELNGYDYTIPAVQLTTSPAIVSINGVNDGAIVTCLMGEFQNAYLIGRGYDLWGLSGYDLTDFTLRKVSDQVGCLEPKSVQEVTNVKYWLSHRGIEGFTGTQINRVSYPIDANIIQVIAAAGNTNTASLSSQADWQSGNLTASGPGAPVSATISPGNVVPSSWGVVTIGLAGDWAMPDLDSTTFVTTYVDNFDDGSLAAPVTWTTSPGYGGFAIDSSNFWVTGSTGPSGTSSMSTPITNATGTWSFVAVSTSSTFPGTPVLKFMFISSSVNPLTADFYSIWVQPSASIATQRVRLGKNISGSTEFVNSTVDPNIQNTSPHTYRVSRSQNGWATVSVDGVVILSTQALTAITSNSYSLLISDDQLGGVTRGHFSAIKFPFFYENQVSGIYDTAFSTPTYSVYAVTMSSVNTSSVTFSVQSSTASNGGGFQALQAQTNGAAITAAARRYFRHHIYPSPPETATVSSVTVADLAAETTAYYITPCILVSSPTSYGNFLVNAVTDGGSFSFAISTGATCAAATNPKTTWNSQTPNSVISVTTTTTYLAGRILFSVTVGAQVPALNDMTFTWNQGGGRPPTASAQWDDRYLLFYTTSTTGSPANDHAFVYDQNQKWQLWDDVYAASAVLYQNTLYTGDSAATGFVYQQDVGQADNGNSFTMKFQTADFDGGDPNMNKQFSRAYIMLGAPNNGNGTASLSCNYSLDGSTSTFSLGSVTLNESPDTNGYFVAKLPFPVGPPTTGHWLNLTCSYLGTVGPVAVHRIRIVYSNTSWD